MNVNEFVKNAQVNANAERAEKALKVAQEYGEKLACEYGADGVNYVNDSYSDVCIPLFGEELISKYDWIFNVRDAWSWKLSELDAQSTSRKRMPFTLKDTSDLKAFMHELEQQPDEYIVENATGTMKVNGKSSIGMMYAFYEEGGMGHNYFLVNNTNDGVFPNLSFLGRAF